MTIVSPVDGDEIPPDQPFSLLGSAHDAAGEPLSPEDLVWRIDGRIVAEGQELAAAGPLPPGDHAVVLEVRASGEPQAAAEVSLVVPERTPEQEEWLRVSAGFPQLE